MNILRVLKRALRVLGCSAFLFTGSFTLSVQAFELLSTAGLRNHVVVRHVLPVRHQTASPIRPAQAGRVLAARTDTALARRWAMAKDRIQAETDWLASCAHGACRDSRAERWHRVVSVIRAAPYAQRPALVHRLLSRKVRYIADGKSDDHWSNPLATLQRGAGDCEDHALLKRAVLAFSGYSEEDTQLLILKTPSGGGHMALRVSGQRPLVLDNRYRYPVTQDVLAKDQVAALATAKGYFAVN